MKSSGGDDESNADDESSSANRTDEPDSLWSTLEAYNYKHSWPSEVVEGFLYLGDWESASDHHVLRTLGIEKIVNCTKDTHKWDAEMSVEIHQVPVNDFMSEDILRYFDEAIDFIGIIFEVYFARVSFL